MTPLNNWRDSDLSALFDDELRAEDAQRCVAGVVKNPVALEQWCAYQEVRACLQGEEGVSTSSAAFLAGFRERLAQENTQQQVIVAVPHDARSAANDAVFRWKLVAGLASCASVAVLAWSLMGHSQPPAAPVLAQTVSPMRGFASPQAIQAVSGFSSVSAQASAEPSEHGQMLRDSALDEFLRAHGSQAGSVMENTAGFMRNATFGGDGL